MSFAQAQQTGFLDQIKNGVQAQKDQAAALEAKAKIDLEAAQLKTEKFQPALVAAQTAAANSLAAARNKAGGKAPSGYEWDTTTDIPTLKKIPGGPQDQKDQEKAAQGDTSLKVAETQIDDLLDILDKHYAVLDQKR